MFQINGRKRIISIIAIIFLANFLLPSFVKAADPDLLFGGELKNINEAGGKLKCETDLAGRLEQLTVDSRWFSFMPAKAFVTARWSEQDKKCYIYQGVPFSQGSRTTGIGEPEALKKAMEGLGFFFDPTPPRNSLGESGSFLRPGDYAKNIESALLNLPSGTNLTKNQAEKTWGPYVDEASDISKLVGNILKYIIQALTSLVLVLTSWAGRLLSWSIETNILKNFYPDIVTVGWTIVRDIMNMVFILALIIMSIATILRIEAYSYKNLLVKVILMALLINFSYVISIFLIDFSNLFVKIFYVNASWDRLIGGYAGSLNDWGISSAGVMSDVMKSGTALILSIVMLVAFLAMALLLVVRTIGLWFLIILSPVAFALNILPATKEYANKWWQTFTKYLIWAPVAIFFLRLSDSLIMQLPKMKDGTSTSFQNLIIMGFVWGSVMVAQQAGMVGSEAIMKGAQAVGFGSSKWLGKRGLGFAGRYYNEWTSKLLEAHEGKKAPGFGRKALFAVLNPKAFAKGWEKRSEELAKMHKELAEAGGREVAEQFLTTPFWTLSSFRHPFRNIKRSFKEGGALRIPYRQFMERHEENEYLKTYTEMKKEALMAAAVEAEKLGGNEGAVRKRSIVKAAAANGYLDDLMRMKQFAKKYAGSDNVVYSAESLNRFLFGYLGHGEQAMRFMAEDMEELGKKVKHYEYLGHAKYDPNKREFTRGIKVKTKATKPNEIVRSGKVYEKVRRGDEEHEVEVLDLNKDSWQVNYSVGEFAKLGGRERVSAAPHNFTTIRAETKADGSFAAEGDELGANDGELHFGREHGDFDAFNQEMLKRMDSDTMREVQHTQARLKSWLVSDKLVVNSQGTIVLEDEEHALELKKIYEINPEFVKGLYTKVLKVKGDQRESIDGIRFALKNDVDIDSTTGTAIFKPGKSFREIGSPKFRYSDNPPKVLNPDGSEIKKSQAQIDAENEPT